MIALSAFCIKYTPPALSMDTLLNFFFIFEFLRRGYFKDIINHFKNFPLKIYYIISFISIGLSGIFSIVSINDFFTTLILQITSEYIMFFLFWRIIKKGNDMILFIKFSVIILFISCCMGIIEFITNNNLMIEGLKNMVDPNLLTGKIYETGERLGLRRVQGLFVSPNNYIYGAFIIILLFTINKYTKYKLNNILPLSFFFIALILLANSRTVLFASIIILYPVLFSVNTKLGRKFITLGIIIFIVSLPFISQYAINITSVINSKASASLAEEGSSLGGRMLQFIGSYELFLKSPIVGNGLGSIEYFLEDDIIRYTILGTESIWMKLMIERGLLGIISYIILFYEMQKRYKILRHKYLKYLTLGYLTANTMSSMPGFSLSFFFAYSYIIHYFINKKINENRYYYNS